MRKGDPPPAAGDASKQFVAWKYHNGRRTAAEGDAYAAEQSLMIIATVPGLAAISDDRDSFACERNAGLAAGEPSETG